MSSEKEKDLFDDIVMLEEQFVQEGARAAEADARSRVLYEADQQAWLAGAELGLEIGFYAGCASVWAALPALSAR